MTDTRICLTCGTEYPEYNDDDICAICHDERQYIPEEGQLWTTHEVLLKTHSTKIIQLRDHLYELFVTPSLAIGQRAFFVESEQGNILWDCIPLLDDDTIDFIKEKGGLKAIAISHPHYYSNMNYWADVFDCPIYIHQKDQDYIVYHSDAIQLWESQELGLWDNLKLINLGGHFDGGSVLYIPWMSIEGVMLCSDILQIGMSKKFIAMMYSYPNNIPLPIAEVQRLKARLSDLTFDTLYGGFRHQNLSKNVRDILQKSIDRYLL